MLAVSKEERREPLCRGLCTGDEQYPLFGARYRILVPVLDCYANVDGGNRYIRYNNRGVNDGITDDHA